MYELGLWHSQKPQKNLNTVAISVPFSFLRRRVFEKLFSIRTTHEVNCPPSVGKSNYKLCVCGGGGVDFCYHNEQQNNIN